MILRQPLTADDYAKAYTLSVTKPDAFWKEQAQILDWVKNPAAIKSTSFHPPVSIKWFEDGQLNVCVNCIDRHLPEKANDVALIWEGDEPGNTIKITYSVLHEKVCRMANVLKAYGVRRGDTVVIYMPMILEATYAMLACARIGAVHSVVFGGFSASSLKDRILDCHARLIITADGGLRGGKTIPLKQNLDEALLHCPHVTSVLVTHHTGNTIAWHERDTWLHEAMSNAAVFCEPEIMGAEDPLFILYTSGSTGKPKGVLHTTAGYLLYAALTHRLVFDYQPGEVYWCTADVGWITGHSYVVYGPLANGATSLIYEGIPNYPTHSRCWEIVDQHKVSIFYTAPTAIRALMREGDEPVKKTSRKSLRILGTVGEPINPEVWNWYANIVGDGHCTVVDTWWQTETGGHMITPLPGAIKTKPGSATLPFFGIQPELLDNDGKVMEGAAAGNLCISDSWPGQARTIWGDHERFVMTYFSAYPGKYFSGDGARRDEDGYYWITGRVDDVLNISGHRLGTAEIESALVLHIHVAEAAVVGIPHDLKGEGIYAFVTLKSGIPHSDNLLKELVQLVRREIGPIASPEAIQFAPSLPKTRSGKIMRRILRQIASGQHDQLGDTSSLADPSVVNDLIAGRKTV